MHAIATERQSLPIGSASDQLERPHLSPREQEVLLQWLATESKQDTCANLYLSVSTVNTHIARIRAKYASVGRPATTKVALLVRALQDNLIAIDDL